VRWLLLVLAASACAARGPEPEAPEPADGPALDDTLRSVASSAVSAPAARRLHAVDRRWQPKTIGAAEPQLSPLGRRQRVTVRFADAELGEALRLLAEAGGFALIVDGQLPGRVNADLRRVRPYEALVALAQARGARVERRGVIVIVTPR
jgi:hypothetical protein